MNYMNSQALKIVVEANLYAFGKAVIRKLDVIAKADIMRMASPRKDRSFIEIGKAEAVKRVVQLLMRQCAREAPDLLWANPKKTSSIELRRIAESIDF